MSCKDFIERAFNSKYGLKEGKAVWEGFGGLWVEWRSSLGLADVLPQVFVQLLHFELFLTKRRHLHFMLQLALHLLALSLQNLQNITSALQIITQLLGFASVCFVYLVCGMVEHFLPGRVELLVFALEEVFFCQSYRFFCRFQLSTCLLEARRCMLTLEVRLK